MIIIIISDIEKLLCAREFFINMNTAHESASTCNNKRIMFFVNAIIKVKVVTFQVYIHRKK